MLRSNDVVVFVGGEDMVAMQENGYLETLLTRALPGAPVRFRSLAWEGDTVFEQRRDLNFPTWEQQLERVGATVIIAQFGQAESLRGRAGLAEFTEAAGSFLQRLAGKSRRGVLVSPTPIEPTPGGASDLNERQTQWRAYAGALKALAHERGWLYVDRPDSEKAPASAKERLTRNGLHWNAHGHWRAAMATARELGFAAARDVRWDATSGTLAPAPVEALRQAILAKNRLWFDYWRPQNWAFLHGDRTSQPSSRDHRDPKVRWFPQELEKFVPLFEAKEKEIAALAGGGTGR